MDCTLCRDYYLPNLLPIQEEEYKIGIYGQRYFRYIKEHDKILFINILTTGKLNEHVAEVDSRAQTMESMLVKQIAEQEGINETLKEQDQIEWVKRMNSSRSRVKEIIWNEIV
ncbi:MAG: TnpV protein [Oscillospiraceae bacterium]|nr:TnpV protein [Oscillospiraceae bacterium]